MKMKMTCRQEDEEVQSEPEKTIDKRIKLNPRKIKITGTGLEILTPNKLLTRLLILLAQIKAGNNSYNVQMKSDKHCIFCINAIASLKKLRQFNEVIIIMEKI